MITLTPQALVKLGSLEQSDYRQIKECRGEHNKLGFCYQLLFVKIVNRFPTQAPFEIIDDMLTFASLQINISSQKIKLYQKRQATISKHQTKIKIYLRLQKFDEVSAEFINAFIFTEASKLDDLSAILARTEQYLRERHILFPAEDTLKRQAIIQREKARQFIYNSMARQLTTSTIKTLDTLLVTGDAKYSKLQKIKMSPLNPSVEGVSKLTEKLDIIESTGIISLDLSWLNNNYQRTLAKYAQRYSAFRLKETGASKRYTILVCFLLQSYRETIDYLADTYFKLITRIYNKAGRQQDKANKKQSKKNRTSLIMFDTVTGIVLNSNIPDIDVRQHIFQAIPKKVFISQSTENKKWLTGKHSHIFKLVTSRFNYLRQFAPKVLSHLQFKDDGQSHTNTNLLSAISTLKNMNELHKRKLPIDVPVNFIPKKIRALIKEKGSVERHGWECAVLTAIRDEVKAGNISVNLSKRVGYFNDFFMPYSEWKNRRTDFFKRAKMPQNPQDVPRYLTTRLNKAIDQFIELENTNEYAKVEDGKWVLSVDEAEKLSIEDQIKLDKLKKGFVANKNQKLI